MNNKQIENHLLMLQQNLLKKTPPIKFDSNRNWTKQFPENPGVYILREKGEICYVGETENLRKRIKSLQSTTSHVARRSIGHVICSKDKNYQPASNYNKFLPEFEKRITEHFNKHIEVSYIEINFGRKELEEKICNGLKKDGKKLHNKKKLKTDDSTTVHSLTGLIKQQLSSKTGFEFKDINEIPSKISFYVGKNNSNIYSRHKDTLNTKEEAKTLGSELKESGKASYIRILNGIKVTGSSRKKVFFVYYLSEKS